MAVVPLLVKPLAAGILAFLILIGALAILRSAGTAATPPDDRPRVVVLSPALGASMRDLGFAHLVVGRHQWDRSLPQTIPVCGDQAAIDYEALVSVSPTVVLTQWGARELPGAFRELVNERGWEHHDLSALALDEVAGSIGRLDTLMRAHTTPEAARIMGEDAERWFRGELSRRVDTPTGPVLMLGATGPFFAFGPGSFHHEILLSIGGVAAVSSGPAWVGLGHEDILAMNPWGIVLVIPGADEGSDPAALLGRMSSSTLGAVASGRVALIGDSEAHLPGTPMARFAGRLRGILSEWTPEQGER